jgi:hypothetical protein
MGFEVDPKDYHRVIDRYNNYACEVFARDVPRDERWFLFYLKDFMIIIKSQFAVDKINHTELFQLSKEVVRHSLVRLGDKQISSSIEEIFLAIAEAIVTLRGAVYRAAKYKADRRVVFV